MDKLSYIQNYIEQIDDVVLSTNDEEVKILRNEIIGVFHNEIQGITLRLPNQSITKASAGGKKDYTQDLKLLKQKLINYATNIKEEREKREHDLKIAQLSQPQISAYAESNPAQVTTVTTNVTITLKQTIKTLEDIPKENLSDEDKETIKDYLYSLEGAKAAKDKKRFWDKGKDLLKFVADKGADAAIAVLPLILQGLQLIQ